ncbi:hypothetical protein BC940DRAFT_295750 [Gongronella butleri]|nr:hypothetical protein BC940DRAFT_295750 [Gongronella butleri]
MSLVNRPNRILAQQRFFQAPSQTPLFLRGPRDRLFVYGTALILGVGLIGSLHGASRMVRDAK